MRSEYLTRVVDRLLLAEHGVWRGVRVALMSVVPVALLFVLGEPS